MADNFDNILQCPYEKVRTAVPPIVYIVVERILFDLLRQEVVEKIFKKPIATYIDIGNAADKVCGKCYLQVELWYHSQHFHKTGKRKLFPGSRRHKDIKPAERADTVPRYETCYSIACVIA